MKSKHTKGLCESTGKGSKRRYIKINNRQIALVHSDSAFTEDISSDENEANAQLIADAFNVTNETGLTPRELQKSHAELLELLEKVDLDMAIDNAIGSKVYDKNLHLKINNAINNAKPNIDEK